MNNIGAALGNLELDEEYTAAVSVSATLIDGSGKPLQTLTGYDSLPVRNSLIDIMPFARANIYWVTAVAPNGDSVMYVERLLCSL